MNKKGEISAIRNKNKSFFNYLWKSIESGIIDILIPTPIARSLKN